jgi:hypothetical protein
VEALPVLMMSFMLLFQFLEIDPGIYRDIKD